MNTNRPSLQRRTKKRQHWLNKDLGSDWQSLEKIWFKAFLLIQALILLIVPQSVHSETLLLSFFGIVYSLYLILLIKANPASFLFGAIAIYIYIVDLKGKIQYFREFNENLSDSYLQSFSLGDTLLFILIFMQLLSFFWWNVQKLKRKNNQPITTKKLSRMGRITVLLSLFMAFVFFKIIIANNAEPNATSLVIVPMALFIFFLIITQTLLIFRYCEYWILIFLLNSYLVISFVAWATPATTIVVVSQLCHALYGYLNWKNLSNTKPLAHTK